MIRYKFSKELNIEFSRVLKQRVSDYFNINLINRTANKAMVVKTFLALFYYLTLYFIILFGGITNLPILFSLWALLGLGQAFIGMAVMHDAVHGTYSKNKFINALLQIPIILIGVESQIWKIEHNQLHHTYTNIEGMDQDIETRYVFRFSENQPRKWFHKFQHLYATFFYSLLIIEWLTIKDFLKVIKYYHLGLIKNITKAWLITLSILLKKIAFFVIFLVIPLQLLDLPNLQIIAMFLVMLVVSGYTLTIIFQTAHVIPSVSFLKPIDESIEENWYVHQMMTTSNFAIGNKIITYLVGSLNYQIEHHLFPEVCHVYYPEISTIVKNTAMEFSIPYHSEKTLVDAVFGHYRLLKQLGQKDKLI